MGGAPRERGAVSSGVSGGECEPRREPCCQQQRAAQGSFTTPLPSCRAPRRCRRRKTDAPKSPFPGSDPRSRQPSTPVSGASSPVRDPRWGPAGRALLCSAPGGLCAPSARPGPVRRTPWLRCPRCDRSLFPPGPAARLGSARSLAGSAGKGEGEVDEKGGRGGGVLGFPGRPAAPRLPRLGGEVRAQRCRAPSPPSPSLRLWI